MRKYLILVLFSIILSGCSFQKNEQKNDIEKIEIPEVDHEYFEVEDKQIQFEEIFNQKQSKYFVYLYSLTCSHCQEMKNFIIDFALKNDQIYFVKSTNKISVKNDVSNSIGATKVEDVSIVGYPSILEIRNKTLVKNVAGKTKIIDLLNQDINS